MFHAGLEMRIYCWNFEFEHFGSLVFVVDSRWTACWERVVGFFLTWLSRSRISSSEINLSGAPLWVRFIFVSPLPVMGSRCMMIVLLLFLQKQNLAFAVYQFWIGTLLTGLGSEKETHVIMFSPWPQRFPGDPPTPWVARWSTQSPTCQPPSP